MRPQPVGVLASLCSLALAALAAPLPAEPPGQVVQKLTPVVQLAVQGTTHIHFDFVGFCDVCDFDRARLVSRQIAIYTNHTLHSDDAFNELWQPGAFAQTVSGLGSPQAFAGLQQDIAAAHLATQPDDCSVPIVYHSTIFDGGQFAVSTALDHDYVLTWWGPGTTMRTLRLSHDRPSCSVELRRVVLDILALEQEVIGDTPKVEA
jgi:hypothetical protein